MATIDSSVDYVDFSCKCEEQTLTRLDSKSLVRGQAYKIVIEFTVSGEWDEMTIYARFQTSDGSIYETAFQDGKVLVPHEATDYAGTFAMALKGVHTSGRIITSTPVTYTVQDTIVGDAENPSEPTPGLLDDVLEASRSATSAANAANTAAEVANTAATNLQTKVDNGDFNGTDGKDGKDGVDGAAASITIGTTTTLDAGSAATVNNVGTSSAAKLNFGIPKGSSATVEIGTVAALAAGSIPTVTNSGTESAVILNFGLPYGPASATTAECEEMIDDIVGSEY